MNIPQERLRNFSIIAHIDHGKSTLADRLLEMTHTIDARQMTSQVLDSMDLEREKGITIKARAVRLDYTARDGLTYGLNLIDTPGHVDFAYEVSHSLQACEGAILVVDAAQGIEAQTLANVHLALREGLTIIPVLNKIDLPSAQPEVVMDELENVLAIPREEVLLASAKEGTGVAGDPRGDRPARSAAEGRPEGAPSGPHLRQPLRPLQGRDRLRPAGAGHAPRPRHDPADAVGRRVGTARAGLLPAAARAREAARRRARSATSRRASRASATRRSATRSRTPRRRRAEPLPGYHEAKSLVFAGIYPISGEDYPLLRDALEKLHLNDASFTYEPESSVALGFGFRCGFLGPAPHGDRPGAARARVRPRPDRVGAVGRIPGRADRRTRHRDGRQPVAASRTSREIEEIREPWVKLNVITPSDLHRAAHGALDEPPRRLPGHGIRRSAARA